MRVDAVEKLLALSDKWRTESARDAETARRWKATNLAMSGLVQGESSRARMDAEELERLLIELTEPPA